jgi:hypothetical protein
MYGGLYHAHSLKITKAEPGNFSIQCVFVVTQRLFIQLMDGARACLMR